MPAGATSDERSTPMPTSVGPDAEEVGGPSPGTSWPAPSAIAVIRFYRRYISGLFPPVCRFRPTCSEYALLAIEKYGFVHGGWRTLKRLLRCHPGHPGGYDPVE